MFSIESINNKCYKIISDETYTSLLVKEDGVAAIVGSPVCTKVVIDNLGEIRRQLNTNSKMSFLSLSGEGNEELYVSRNSQDVFCISIDEEMTATVNINYILAIMGKFSLLSESLEYLKGEYVTFKNKGDLEMLLTSEGSPIALQGPIKVNSANVIGWKGDYPRKVIDPLVKGCDLEFGAGTQVILQPGKEVRIDNCITEVTELVQVTETKTKTVTSVKNTSLNSILDF